MTDPRPTLRPYQSALVTGLADKLGQGKLCGVYMLFWQDGHFYIGSSIHIHERFSQHLRALRDNRHHNIRLQEMHAKNGNPELMILMRCKKSGRLECEQQYLDAHFNNPLCCNISPSAYDQTGVKRRPETIKKMRQANIGKEMPESVRLKISKTCGERWKAAPWHTGLQGEKNPFYGKRHSDEAKAKMRRSKNVGGDNIRARIVINLETGVFYDCAREAAESSIYKQEHLRGMLNGNKRNKTSFRYA